MIIVTGPPRSGTSMMMGALHVSGYPAHYSLDRERELQSHDKLYNPMFYEPPIGWIGQPYPEEPFSVKMVGRAWINFHLANLNPDHIIVCTRGGVAHRQALRATGLYGEGGKDWFVPRLIDDVEVLGYTYTLAPFEQIIDSPIEYFTELARYIPIDPSLAAGVIDPSQPRNLDPSNP